MKTPAPLPAPEHGPRPAKARPASARRRRRARRVQPNAFPPKSRIAVGAIVEIEDADTGEGRTFLAPVGAGITLTGPGGDTSVVTPVSPIGAVLGRITGEVVDVTVEGDIREWQITYVG
ncbi:MAG: hypothetical protein WKG01_30145 [Kofleriaceae bacterium]